MLEQQTVMKKKTVRKQTFNKTLKQPIAVYPSLVGVLAGMYGLVMGFGLLSLAVCLGGLIAGLGGWAFEFLVRGKSHALNIMNEYLQSLKTERKQAIIKLEGDIAAIQQHSALEQLGKLSRKYDNFVDILNSKLDKGELTYNRYLAIGEQVFLNSLDNLQGVVLSSKSISAIDIHAIKEKLANLDDDDPALKPLSERQKIWQKQTQSIADLLLENENAMTALDQVASKLATVQTQTRHAQLDMENAMGDLENLIERADKYAR